MQTDFWRQVEELFQAAQALPPEKRARLLEGADPKLRSEVQSLLDAAPAAQSFLEGIPISSVRERSYLLTAGRRLGSFEILAPIGRGGMGEVYRARDLRLKREVAIKVLAGEVTEAERKRFLREAQAASALNHPNIITIYEVGEQDGVSYIAMECVAGKTLSALIPSRGMRPNDAVDLAVQLAGALAAAHAAGIVHRDLKPGNVMMTDSGTVKVLDFGLAKRSETIGRDETTQTIGPDTEAGTVLGTVGYMSPEQAEGRPVDTRSDIFSFGSILYEMLSGKRAFRGDSHLSTLAAIIRDEPAPLNAAVPAELRKIVSRCLSKDVGRRYQHIGDVRLALEELRVPTPRRRWLYIAAAILLVILPGAVWLLRGVFTKPSAPPQIIPLTTYPGLQSWARFSPDGNQVVFAWDGGQHANRNIYVRSIGTPGLSRLTTGSADDWCPVYSPDGRSIGFIRSGSESRNGSFVLIPAIGGPEHVVAEIPDVFGFDWFPDGKQIVLTGLRLMSVETGEIRQLTHLPEGSISDCWPAVSPDGRTVAFGRFVGSNKAEVFLLTLTRDLKPRGEPRRLTFMNGWCGYPVWTGDGRDVISVAKGDLYRVAASGAGHPEPLHYAQMSPAMPAISRDGKRLVFTRCPDDQNIWRLPLSGPGVAAGPPVQFLSSTRADHGPTYSSDGRFIVFQSTRSGTNEIWLSDAEGTNPSVVPLEPGAETGGSPRFSPDGKWIAFSSDSDVFIVARAGGRPKRLTTSNASTYNQMPSWSRDGRWIYMNVWSGNERPNIWKMPATGGVAVQLTSKGGYGAIESPDGRLIYYMSEAEGASPLWRMPSGGGIEKRVLPSVEGRAFAVVEKGIYFVPGADNRRYSIQYLDFASGKVRLVTPITASPRAGLDVSPDGRFLLYNQDDTNGADLMLVENFR